MAMKREDILDLIKGLARSTGMYGRVYEELLDMQIEDQEQYEKVMQEWENKKFEQPVDFICWFEGGDETEEEARESEYDELQEIIDTEVMSWSTYDYSEQVYVYKEAAYIGESGWDALVKQIKEDHHLGGK